MGILHNAAFYFIYMAKVEQCHKLSWAIKTEQGKKGAETTTYQTIPSIGFNTVSSTQVRLGLSW